MLGEFSDHCRFALRIFRKSPGFHFVAAGSLALGIGAATAIFSLAWAVLIDPFPYRDPASILATSWFDGHTEWGRLPFHVADAEQLRRQSRTAAAVVYSQGLSTLATGTLPEQLNAAALSSNTFDFLGVAPARGRFFGDSDIASPASPQAIAVLSYSLWHRRYQADPAIVGKAIELNHRPFTIVGIAPQRFTWENADIYLPLAVSQNSRVRVSVNLRPRPGVPDSAINAELAQFTAEFARNKPDWYPPRYEFRVRSLRHFVLGDFTGTVGVLSATVALLLLIACGNASILLLARAGSRAKEVAIRFAMGAPRPRLFRQFLTESVLLALVGAAAGVALAAAGVPALLSILPPASIPEGLEVHLNGWVLGFALASAILTGLLFGCAPALHLSRTGVRQAMQETSRSSTGSQSTVRLRNMLVVGQVALCATLLAVAGVAIRGLAALSQVRLGFAPSHILVVNSDLGGPARAFAWEERKNYQRRIRDAVARLPGVEAVSAVFCAEPPHIAFPEAFEISGQPSGPNQEMMLGMVDADYFRTLKAPLLRGRSFLPDDIDRARNVVVINEVAARTFWPGRNPVGQTIRMPDLVSPPGNWVSAPDAGGLREIIGVVATIRNHGLIDQPGPAAYVPFPAVMGLGQTLLIRTTGAPNALIGPARAAVRDVNPDQVLSRVATLEDNLDKIERGTSRFTASLFSVFGGVALLLAASGIYSVISYAVALRTGEFGVRFALGATPASVGRLVIVMTMRLVLTGLALGVVVSAALSGWIVRYLRGFNPADPLALTSVVLLLSLVAMMAILSPVIRAVSAQPVDALRHE